MCEKHSTQFVYPHPMFTLSPFTFPLTAIFRQYPNGFSLCRTHTNTHAHTTYAHGYNHVFSANTPQTRPQTKADPATETHGQAAAMVNGGNICVFTGTSCTAEGMRKHRTLAPVSATNSSLCTNNIQTVPLILRLSLSLCVPLYITPCVCVSSIRIMWQASEVRM